MKIAYEHGFSTEEAYKRIDSLLDELQQNHAGIIKDPNKSWNDDYTQMEYSVSIMSFQTAGTISLHDGKVTLEGSIPWQVKPFKRKIENTIRSQLEKTLSENQ